MNFSACAKGSCCSSWGSWPGAAAAEDRTGRIHTGLCQSLITNSCVPLALAADLMPGTGDVQVASCCEGNKVMGRFVGR